MALSKTAETLLAGISWNVGDDPQILADISQVLNVTPWVELTQANEELLEAGLIVSDLSRVTGYAVK